MSLHLPDGNASIDGDNKINNEVKGSNEDDKYSDEDEDEEEWMLSKKIIWKCNLLNLTISQELFNMGIIWKFQMIHCIIKNMYANKLFEIGIIYYFLYVMFPFWELGAVASNVWFVSRRLFYLSFPSTSTFTLNVCAWHKVTQSSYQLVWIRTFLHHQSFHFVLTRVESLSHFVALHPLLNLSFFWIGASNQIIKTTKHVFE